MTKPVLLGSAPRWRRWSTSALLAGVILFAHTGQAQAKWFQLALRLHAGGMAGIVGGDKIDPAPSIDPRLAEAAGDDFFIARRGGAFGFVLEIEVLFVDLIYEFYQMADQHGLGSTLNNFFVGFDWDVSIGKNWLITPYIVGGFGLATQNNSWLSKKYPQIALADLESRLIQVRAGARLEKKLSRFFRFGIDIGFGYHYGLESRAESVANDLSTHYHGFHFLGNIFLAFDWDPFAKKKKKRRPKPAPRPDVSPVPGQNPPAGTTPGATTPGTTPGSTTPGTTPGTTTPGTTPDSTTPSTPPSKGGPK